MMPVWFASHLQTIACATNFPATMTRRYWIGSGEHIPRKSWLWIWRTVWMQWFGMIGRRSLFQVAVLTFAFAHGLAKMCAWDTSVYEGDNNYHVNVNHIMIHQTRYSKIQELGGSVSCWYKMTSGSEMAWMMMFSCRWSCIQHLLNFIPVEQMYCICISLVVFSASCQLIQIHVICFPFKSNTLIY